MNYDIYIYEYKKLRIYMLFHKKNKNVTIFIWRLIIFANLLLLAMPLQVTVIKLVLFKFEKPSTDKQDCS